MHMFKISSYLTRAGFIGKQSTEQPEADKAGKVCKAEKTSQSEKVGKADNAKRADKADKAERMSKAQRCSPTLSSFVHAAARGVSRSTADNYRTAVRSFVRFNGGRDIPLSALNADTVRAYERWLQDRGVCPNTSSCYMRSLRAIHNKAASKRLVKDRKPFKGVFTGNSPTVKRGITAGELRRLKSLSPAGGGAEAGEAGRKRTAVEAAALDFFLFSFYAMGMSFADLAGLRRPQVRDGVLTYRRRKTGRQVRVTLEPCMLDILDKYATRESDYLFPILYKVKGGEKDRTKGGETDKGKDGGKGRTTGGTKRGNPVEVSYSSALNRYNRALKTLAREAGIAVNLTSYVARHSWASIAYEGNVDLPVISKALGHTDTKTTLIYIGEINDTRPASANRKLLEEVFPS